jgi:alpha-glucosidase
MASFSLKQLIAITRSLGIRVVAARVGYYARGRVYNARFAPGSAKARSLRDTLSAMVRGPAEPPPEQPLGNLLSYDLDGQAVHLVCSHGALHLDVMAADLIRFRLLPAGSSETAPPFSYALDPAGSHAPDAQRPPVAITVEESADSLTIRTGELTCRVDRSPCRLSFLDAQGQPLSEAADGPGFQGKGVYWTRRLVDGEALYGTGERTFDLNLRGRTLELWNRDAESYAPGVDPIHLCIPMLVGLRDGRAYGFLFDNPGRAHLDLGQTRQEVLRYQADTGELCAYFFGGGSIPAVLARYTQLTGRMPLPPRWMLGYHQSRWSYYPEARVRALAGEFRSRRIPCDVIHLDIHYLDGYRVFTWDSERFPDPPQMLADLREQGFRAISIVDPGVKAEPGYHVHDEGLAREVFCRLPDGTLYKAPVWPGQCYFPDYTDPEARAWWGDLYEPLLETGITGFWNDMNEPAIFGGEMPHGLPHNYEGRGATHGEIHNVYGLQMARASAEGLRRLRPDERVPLISRSGYAGLQRYALVWTGDNHSTWAQLRMGVSMCLNLGLSGLAFCGPDIGGFASDCDGELLARWTQVGALTPFFRNHSALGTQEQEPWAFGEPYESICRRWIELRYELLPAIYTAAWQAAQTGLPMMRPLALAYPQDKRTYSLDDQFLFGDALMAAPVGHAGQRSRRVYLPEGTWYDFWTGARLEGNSEVTADAPLERMPLYVRAGSVLPMAPVMQHTGEWPPEALRLRVYPGNGESWLYEDDGQSMAFQSGELQITRFACEEAGKAFTVCREADGAFEPGYEQFEVEIYGLEVVPQQVQVDGAPVETAFDAETGTARLQVGAWARIDVEKGTA